MGFCSKSVFVVFCFGLGWTIVSQPNVSEGGTMCAIMALGDDKTLDLKGLHGRWHIDGIYSCDPLNGEIKDLLGIWKETFVIVDGRLSLEIEGVKWLEWSVEFDIKKKPAWIDLTLKYSDTEKDRKIKMKGLVKLDKDNLVIHLGTDDARPTSFQQGKGLDSMLFKCK